MAVVVRFSACSVLLAATAAMVLRVAAQVVTSLAAARAEAQVPQSSLAAALVRLAAATALTVPAVDRQALAVCLCSHVHTVRRVDHLAVLPADTSVTKSRLAGRDRVPFQGKLCPVNSQILGG